MCEGWGPVGTMLLAVVGPGGPSQALAVSSEIAMGGIGGSGDSCSVK